MRNRRCFLLAAGLLLRSVLAQGELSDPRIGVDPRAGLVRSLGPSSLYFIENQGQVAVPARYYVRGRDRTVFVGDDALTMVLRPGPGAQHSANPVALRLEFVGARPNPLLRGEGAQGPAVNLFTGGREKWRTGLPTYSRLVYTDLWPGIDLALVGDVQHIKYEFRVEPGADPRQIRLRYRGADTLRIEPTGDLAIDTPLGTLRDPRPFSYQESGGTRTEITTHYALVAAEDGTFGFALAGYDRTKPLVLDPAVFVYASYLGGSSEDRGTFVAVDRYGAAYVTGITTSSEASFPTGTGFGSIPGFDKAYAGGYDVFVAKILPSGLGLEYVTYVGGSGNDVSAGIAVDSSGNAYVAGYTNNVAQFPVVGGPTTNYQGGSNDIFLLKLNPSGTALVYSGFIGGDGEDREPALALDNAGSVYLTGLTYSSQSTFPTGTGFGGLPGADQTYNGDADAFVVKVKPDGSGLQFASYIGGSAFDNGYNIGIDAARNVYVGGNVGSDENTFPDGDGVGTIPGPDTTYNGGAFDAFVVKLNAEGTSFAYVAFVGGAGGSERDERYATGLAVDPQGSAWIAGGRASAEDTFPTGQGFGSIPGFDRTSNGGRDAFVVKINSEGTAFAYATYIGGSGDDEVTTMAVDSQGRAYLTGWTSSTATTFPDGDGFGGISGPDTTYNGGPHDAFVVELNTAGTGVVYATYIGGPGGGFYDELGTGIAVDGSGNAYVTGYTTSGTGFPGGSGFGSLPGFDQSYNGGLADAFLVKISSGGSQSTITVDAGIDTAVLVGTPVSLHGSTSAAGCAPVYSWRFVGRPAASMAALNGTDSSSSIFTPDVEGIYTLELAVSCGLGFGKDVVRISAAGCGSNAIKLDAVDPRVRTGGSLSLTAQPAGAVYTWTLAQQGSGPSASLSPTIGQTVNYVAGQSPGRDVIHVTSSVCGQADLTIAVLNESPPEALGKPLLSPNPTQGAEDVSVLQVFSRDIDQAEVCVDLSPSQEPGACIQLDESANLAAGHIDTTALSFAPHLLRFRARSGMEWGPLSSPVFLHVTRNVAILLLNGYNFCTTGPHPEQWSKWRDEHGRGIRCQIQDYFFNNDIPSAECRGDNSACPSNSSMQEKVCVVDNLDGRGDIKANLGKLETYISSRPSLRDADGLILIGHSYGGQIARLYGTRHPEKVLEVITLDTPHDGTPLAAALDDQLFAEASPEERASLELVRIAIAASCSGSPAPSHANDAIRYFEPSGSMDLNLQIAIESLARNSWASVDAIASDLRTGSGQDLQGDDDVVPVDSQRGLGVNDGLTPSAHVRKFVAPSAEIFSHENGLSVLLLRFQALHNVILEKREAWQQLFEAKVKPALAKLRGSQGAIEAAPQVTQGAGLLPELHPQYPEQTVATASGMLTTSGSSEMLEFEVGASAELVVSVVTIGSNPAVVLTAPDHTLLTARNVNQLSRLYAASQDAMGLRQVFVVRNPLPGQWSVEISLPVDGGAHAPSTGSFWSALVSERSPLDLRVSLGDRKFLPGEIVDVRGALEMNGAGVLGAEVSADVNSRIGDPIAIVTLLDDGQHRDGTANDGVYGGSFMAGAPGEYEVSVAASGSSVQGAFNRRKDLQFSVGTLGATASGPFIEEAPDDDGDGRYDSLRWRFMLTVPEEGDYMCFGDLLAADGSLVTHALASVHASAAGTYAVELSFSGLDIYRKAKLGPYSLTNLYLTVSTSEGERLIGRPTDFVTSGGPYWSWMSFQRDETPAFIWVYPTEENPVGGNEVTLQWNVFDGNGATTLDLYYDTTGSGFSGAPIVTGLAATQGSMTYTWDMTGLADGEYFVYARVRNGEFSDAVYGGSIRKLLDSDGDRMPDVWESAHGLNPSSSADAYLDPDGDGLSDLDECLNGTDPQDADTDDGGEPDLSEAVNGRDGTDSGDDVTGVTVASVSPGEGDSRGGEQVLVLGSGFQNGATVDFGGAPALDVTFMNSTRLIVTTPPHALGTVDVTVSNPGGSGSAMKAGAFAFLCEFVAPPVAFNNASNSALCAGQDLQLGTSGISGATFSWTGPNGFTSSLQNPTISQAGAAASGVYTVTMQIGSCSLQATTSALVHALPTVTVSGDQAFCPESNASIQANLTGEPPWTLAWSDGFSQSGVATSPATRLVSPTSDTTYSVTSISDAHCSGTASGSAAITVNCTMFHTLTPCRVLDTRGPAGDNGGPALAGGTSRVFPFAGRCGIPATAKAVAVNVTVVDATRLGHLRLYPGGDPLPGVSTINFLAGQTRANNAIVRLGTGGTVAIYSGQPSGDTVQAIIDVTGYFE